MAFPSISLAVVGVDFANRKNKVPRRFEIATCRPGDPVELAPEPKNPADPNAVMVLSERGIQIGYVKAERAPLVRRMMREGAEVRAVFQESAPWGAVVRVTFDGSDPELPHPAVEADQFIDDDSGFYADYIPPDD